MLNRSSVIDLRRLRIDWTRVALRHLPFADSATPDLPLPRLLRLSLFQVTVGMVAALTVGTLNRVMIVELGVGSWLVAAMIALPVLVAPLRALVGLRSDLHASVLGWRRVPYIWSGTLLQFGGLAIMPFALVLLGGGETPLQLWAGRAAAALAFVLVGAGAQTVQTAGLALATDLAREDKRPRVVALMYVMLLAGMVGSGVVFALLLADYSATRLVQVVQGAAVATVVLNLAAAWKQEPRDAVRGRAARERGRTRFAEHWQRIASAGRTRRFLVAVGLGALAFNMQDVILEPYGGEVLGLGVGATTLLTGLMAAGALAACALAARLLARGADPHAVAAWGAVVGLFAFAAVALAAPLGWPMLFRAGAALIGLGGGLFAVGTLTAAMALEAGSGLAGLALGAWGAVQAGCAGIAILLGGVLRDAVGTLALQGRLGDALAGPATGYGAVYHLEILLLLAALVAIGPLVRARRAPAPGRFGLADLPG